MGNLVQLGLTHTGPSIQSKPAAPCSSPPANIQQIISSSPPPNNNTITAPQHPPNSYKLGRDTVCTSQLWELLQNSWLIIKEMEIILDDCHWYKVVSQQRWNSLSGAGWNVITRVRMEPVMGLTIVLGPGLFLEAHHQFRRTENTSYSCFHVIKDGPHIFHKGCLQKKKKKI